MKNTRIDNCKFIKLEEFIDSKGTLQVIENIKDLKGNLVNFPRCYFLSNFQENQRRGIHAHKKLYQFFLIFNGRCKIKINDGQNEDILKLKQGSGLLIVPGIWRELYDFSSNSLIVVLASELYDIEDYIFEKDEFLKYKS